LYVVGVSRRRLSRIQRLRTIFFGFAAQFDPGNRLPSATNGDRRRFIPLILLRCNHGEDSRLHVAKADFRAENRSSFFTFQTAHAAKGEPGGNDTP
jgi:hypothetical protein